MHLRRQFAIALAVTGVAALPSPASAGVAYPDADWTEVAIPSNGATLHADVLRPKGATEKTPVILSIGPYFNKSGQTGPAGPVQGASYDPVNKSPGPSERFKDFVDGSGLLKKGYTFVMVDLRGYGGSTGCLDWGGPGETADVKAAVEWAASQPWSTGAVGLYGKSYDGVTGLIGANITPKGLKAVIAQEPVYDLYRYLYGDGQRRLNSAATPALYDAIALTPGGLREDPMYNIQGATDPACLAKNWAEQGADDDHNSAYWKARNLILGAKGSKVPLFVTQGTTENNTVGDGLAQYLQNHDGPQRGWLGPWEHVRGDEKCGKDDLSTGCTANNIGRLKMGRKGWNEEALRFYDRYLRGAKPKVEDPAFAVQDNSGTWRGEAAWPPADTSLLTTTLKTGTYTDTAESTATGSGGRSGIWTISPVLKHDARLVGSGRASITVRVSVPRANLAIDVYDLNKDGVGPLITRQGALVYRPGETTIDLDLWSQDWKIAAGRRIGVRITETNTDWWMLAVPTRQEVEVKKASVSLPFLRYKRNDKIQGDPGIQLANYLGKVVTLPAATLTAGETSAFNLPGAMVDRPVSPRGGSTPGAPSGPSVSSGAAEAVTRGETGKATSKAKRIKVRLVRRGRTLIATGRAPKGSALALRLVSGKRTVTTRRVKVGKKGTFRLVFKTKKAGRYSVKLSGTSAGTKLAGASKALRLK